MRPLDVSCDMPELRRCLRISAVRVLADFRLRLSLTDGTTIERKVARLLRGPLFADLREDPEQFAQVQVEGATVRWPNEADLVRTS
jgi:hypothetical protein